MKKSFFYLLSLIFSLFILCSCSQSTSDQNTPEATVKSFMKALQNQDYSTTETYYAENMDNMANFRNQVEVISPHVATELFNKMSDFTYVINDVTIDSSDSSKAIANVTITAYDLGSSFESTVLDYIKSDIEMTFDGAKSEDIIKSIEDTLVNDIKSSDTTFDTTVDIHLTNQDDSWKVDKISDNPELLNALSGNIIHTINSLKKLNNK